MAIVAAVVVVGDSGSMMWVASATSVRVPQAAGMQVWVSVVAAVMMAAGSLGRAGSWAGFGMQEGPGSSPAVEAGTEAPVVGDKETEKTGVSQRPASMGIGKGLARGRASAPGAAGACGDVGK